MKIFPECVRGPHAARRSVVGPHWPKKNFYNTCILSAVSASTKQQKQVGKMPEIRKNFNFEVVMTFLKSFCKNFGVIYKFSSFGLDYMSAGSNIWNVNGIPNFRGRCSEH